MTQSWVTKAKKSGNFVSLGLGYEKETYSSGLQKGAYLWTGLGLWKRIALAPFYAVWVLYQCVRGQDVHVAFIKEKDGDDV